MKSPLAFDAQALAKALNVSLRHVETLHASGRLPTPLFLGRSRRWVVSEIQEWLRAGAPSRELWEQHKRELSR